MAVVPGNSATGTTVSTDQQTLTVGAGASKTFNVTLSGTIALAGSYSGSVTLSSSSLSARRCIYPYLYLVGDGLTPNVLPLYGTDYYGVVGQDLGPVPIQVVDLYGVPVVGASVTFTANSRGSVTLKPVPGVPGGNTSDAIPFVPSTCTPATTTISTTCTTDSNGIAWVELVGGATPIDYYSPVSVDAVALGQRVSILVSLIPAPVLSNVTDAGAFGSTIAPGSYVSLFGSGLMDGNFLINAAGDVNGDSVDAAYTGGRLPLAWYHPNAYYAASVAVSFDAGSGSSAVSVPGYVYYVSPSQINIYAPWELKDYTSAKMKVTMTYNGADIRSNVVTVPVANYSPAFLMYGSGSVFIADAVDGVNCPAPYIIGVACPATRGQSIQLYVNGLGPVTNQPASGDPAPSDPAKLAQTPTLPVVTIGGSPATVQFAGLAPGFVGLYQVNAIVPPGIGTGNQTITISIGGKTSPSSISSGSTTYQIVLPVR